MYTHCPHCDTYFRITSEQLKSANGNVRCGRCFGTFDALQQLVDESPIDDDDDIPADEEITVPRTLRRFPQEDQPVETVETIVYPKHEHSQQLIEELQNQTSRSPSGKRLLWGLSIIPLVALLLLQYSYFNLDTLAQQTQLRPALAVLASLTGRELPLQRAPQHIKLLQRDIRAHQDKPETLVVSAVIDNQAGFTQAFPLMQLSMQDITGQTIAGRRFLPNEYLADKSIDINKGITPNQRYQILLELVDPGDAAVGFKFEFF